MLERSGMIRLLLGSHSFWRRIAHQTAFSSHAGGKTPAEKIEIASKKYSFLTMRLQLLSYQSQSL